MQTGIMEKESMDKLVHTAEDRTDRYAERSRDGKPERGGEERERTQGEGRRERERMQPWCFPILLLFS